MSTPAARNDQEPSSVPQTSPASIGYGHPEYNFVQGLMEIQKTLGEFRSDINANTKAIDSLKTKVDDLVGWKHRIVGGVVVVGILCSALAFLIGKFWDYFSFRAPQATATVSTPAAPPPQPSAPAPERTGNRR